MLERRDLTRTREKTLPSFLKMAAIATIADAVPLRGENRVIATLGLRELRRPAGFGLRALFAAAALDPSTKQITGFDVAFRVAPRINAAGRMDVASEVIELFRRATARGPRSWPASWSGSTGSGARPRAQRWKRLWRGWPLMPTWPRRYLPRPACWWWMATDGIAALSASCFAGGGAHRETGHRDQRGRRRCAWLGTQRGRIPASERNRELRGPFHALRRPRLRGGLRHARGNVAALKQRLNAYAAIHLAAREAEHILRIHAELPLDRITPVLAGWLRKLEPLGMAIPSRFLWRARCGWQRRRAS